MDMIFRKEDAAKPETLAKIKEELGAKEFDLPILDHNGDYISCNLQSVTLDRIEESSDTFTCYYQIRVAGQDTFRGVETEYYEDYSGADEDDLADKADSEFIDDLLSVFTKYDNLNDDQEVNGDPVYVEVEENDVDLTSYNHYAGHRMSYSSWGWEPEEPPNCDIDVEAYFTFNIPIVFNKVDVNKKVSVDTDYFVPEDFE